LGAESTGLDELGSDFERSLYKDYVLSRGFNGVLNVSSQAVADVFNFVRILRSLVLSELPRWDGEFINCSSLSLIHRAIDRRIRSLTSLHVGTVLTAEDQALYLYQNVVCLEAKAYARMDVLRDSLASRGLAPGEYKLHLGLREVFNFLQSVLSRANYSIFDDFRLVANKFRKGSVGDVVDVAITLYVSLGDFMSFHAVDMPLVLDAFARREQLLNHLHRSLQPRRNSIKSITPADILRFADFAEPFIATNAYGSGAAEAELVRISEALPAASGVISTCLRCHTAASNALFVRMFTSALVTGAGGTAAAGLRDSSFELLVEVDRTGGAEDEDGELIRGTGGGVSVSCVGGQMWKALTVRWFQARPDLQGVSGQAIIVSSHQKFKTLTSISFQKKTHAALASRLRCPSFSCFTLTRAAGPQII
jgi:hypothetical protein